MSSKREQIIAALATTLAGTTGVSTRIYRSRLEAFQRNEAPALVIEPGQDQATIPAVSTRYIDWTLQVMIAVASRGDIPDQAADPTIASIHSKVMADRTLGGLVLDVYPQSVVPNFEKADATAAWTVCTYQVRYRTSVDSIES
ncbi:MAG: hypothetical protein WCQ20_15065 [Synechococcaceae cyanobacterium ELA739]|jgi:hypothetical protein